MKAILTQLNKSTDSCCKYLCTQFSASTTVCVSQRQRVGAFIQVQERFFFSFDRMDETDCYGVMETQPWKPYRNIRRLRERVLKKASQRLLPIYSCRYYKNKHSYLPIVSERNLFRISRLLFCNVSPQIANKHLGKHSLILN